MEQKYVVRFFKNDPETPPTMEEQIAIAREAARKLGVPNAESKPLYRIGRNSHTGEAWAYVEWTWEGLGRSDDAWGPVSRFASTGRWSLATPP
jgi:hypothetical protein